MYTFLRFPDFRRKAVTLSYDDGMRDDVKLIEILNRYGLKATFNLNSELFGQSTKNRHLTKDEAIELYANSGHEIAVHGAKHLSLTEVDDAVAIRDIIRDRENLESIFGRIVKGMAYANGSADAHTAELMKQCGISYARTVRSTGNFRLPQQPLLLDPTCHHNDPSLSDLVRKFTEVKESDYLWSNTPRLFYLWGHTYEFTDQGNWDLIESFAESIANRPDIWYATNGEIIDYLRDYRRIEYSVDGRLLHNPTNTDLFLCYYGKNILLPAGATLRAERNA